MKNMIKMKHLSITRKIISVSLSAMFLCTFLLGCSKFSLGTPREVTYVSDDEKFFDVVSFDISEHYTSEHLYNYVEPRVLYYGENEMITSIKTSTLNRDGTINDSMYYEKFDYEGNKLGLVRQGYTSSVPMTSLFVYDGEYYGIFPTYYMSSNYIIYRLDFETEVLVECSRFSLDEPYELISKTKPVYVGDDILILTESIDGLYLSSMIISIDVDGNCNWEREFDFGIYNYLRWDDNSILLCSADNRFYIYNFPSNELEEIVVDRQQYDKYLSNGTVCDNGNLCLVRPDRIDALNLRDMSETILADYNYCDYYMSDFASCQIEFITQDKIVLHDTNRNKPGESIYGWKTIVLTCDNHNPYVGRPILEIAQMQGVNDLIGAGVYEYNNSQTDYFAYVSGRYNIAGDFVIPEIYGEDLTPTQIKQLIIDQLKLDIFNGDGPDIIIGLGDTTVLNHPDYLCDFNELIDSDSDIHADDYFTNGFYAFQNDNGLFQIPLEIGGYGIQADIDNGYSDGNGFTYEGYLYLVEANNGFDMMSYRTRNEYMEYLYRSNERYFFNNGRPNFDCDEFRAMATYLYNNVTEDGLDPESDDCFMITHSHPKYFDYSLSSFYEDIQYYEIQSENRNLYGIPSLRAQGPVLSVVNSIAIATCTSNIDASWDFVKSMLSENVQLHAINNPINVSAYYIYAQNSLELIYFKMCDNGIGRYYNLSEDDIERYRLMLDRIDHTDAIDTEIYAIVCEEIPSYFCGDKTLDQVIEIINQRARLVVNERG